MSWIIHDSLSSSGMYFEFGDPASTTDAQRLNNVCKTLSTLPALQDLKMIFFHESQPISETDLLTPLLQIAGLRSFQVQLPWSKENAFEPMDREVPFEIERLPVSLYANHEIEEDEYIERSHRNRRGAEHLGWRLLCILPLLAIYVISRDGVKSVKKRLSKTG